MIWAPQVAGARAGGRRAGLLGRPDLPRQAVGDGARCHCGDEREAWRWLSAIINTLEAVRPRPPQGGVESLRGAGMQLTCPVRARDLRGSMAVRGPVLQQSEIFPSPMPVSGRSLPEWPWSQVRHATTARCLAAPFVAPSAGGIRQGGSARRSGVVAASGKTGKPMRRAKRRERQPAYQVWRARSRVRRERVASMPVSTGEGLGDGRVRAAVGELTR
jgi:hypothetical protein